MWLIFVLINMIIAGFLDIIEKKDLIDNLYIFGHKLFYYMEF